MLLDHRRLVDNHSLEFPLRHSLAHRGANRRDDARILILNLLLELFFVLQELLELSSSELLDRFHVEAEHLAKLWVDF